MIKRTSFLFIAHKLLNWRGFSMVVSALVSNNNNNNNNNNFFSSVNNFFNEKILLTTMLTIKVLFTINLLEKKKNLFIQNTIYNFCRFKKHLI